MVNIEQYVGSEWIKSEDVQKQKEWICFNTELDKDNKPVATIMFNGVKKKYTLAKDVCKDLDTIFEGFLKQTDVAFGKILVLETKAEINKKTNNVMTRIKVNVEATKERNKILRVDTL